ncbi:tyrosine recombinase XerC [Parahaliea maris]|uniref:Tyrosine recombinase XerC n=1 Tax=Parahaliea maris TaxID=2716870 RepID=A0A5C9A0Q4_9GAMM|nr:tyrosine recombinase XerC [Parahaliea maris]
MSATSLEFLDYLRDVRRLSPHTLSNYRRDLVSLEQWCQQRDISDPGDLVEADIRGWVSYLHRRGLAGNSIQRSLSACRALFDYLGRHHGLPSNPARGVRAPRSPRKLPRTLDVDQVNRFLSTGDDDALVLRDLAMAELLYSSGLRLSELVAANIEDYDRSAGLITVTGKGSKTRTLPVGSMAAQAIERWLVLRAPAAEDSAGTHPLFTSSRGRRISQRSVQQRLRLLGRRGGMDRDVHPHMLRHSFASHMLESSGDLRAVQELLGHANIATTQIYTHLDFQHLAKVYDNAHPRARRSARSDEEET